MCNSVILTIVIFDPSSFCSNVISFDHVACYLRLQALRGKVFGGIRLTFYGDNDMVLATVVLGTRAIVITQPGGNNVEKEAEKILG